MNECDSCYILGSSDPSAFDFVPPKYMGFLKIDMTYVLISVNHVILSLICLLLLLFNIYREQSCSQNSEPFIYPPIPPNAATELCPLSSASALSSHIERADGGTSLWVLVPQRQESTPHLQSLPDLHRTTSERETYVYMGDKSARSRPS